MIVTDTDGHLVGLSVHAAGIQDRDGALSKTAVTPCRGSFGIGFGPVTTLLRSAGV